MKMKKILSFLAFLGLSFGGQAVAQDSSFDREFSKFDKDFERLNSWKAETPASKKLKRRPAAPTTAGTADASGNAPATESAGMTTPLNDESNATSSKSVDDHPTQQEDAAPAKVSSSPKLPKGAKVERLAHNERLGNQISDPVMRKKVQDLYKRSDVVVQQYVLPTN